MHHCACSNGGKYISFRFFTNSEAFASNFPTKPKIIISYVDIELKWKL